ncbi:MAG: 50S ribosomal protein L24 [Opitutae bacterium]|nr:50S ribosomal protein L24 [Opitutae bacterium]MCD8298417.1 50S ribosomal protein L24 [Opitutae bacterium]
MPKQNIKKGDEVVVIAGSEKGKRGKVASVIPSKKRVIIEGLNIVKRHTKANEQAGVEGGIIDKEAPIHISNVMAASVYDAKRASKK